MYGTEPVQGLITNGKTTHTELTTAAAMQVPQSSFEMSSYWFVAVIYVSLISFIFESTEARRQLACLTCTIKAIAWHADFVLTRPNASQYVCFDGTGQP